MAKAASLEALGSVPSVGYQFIHSAISHAVRIALRQLAGGEEMQEDVLTSGVSCAQPTMYGYGSKQNKCSREDGSLKKEGVEND